MTGFTSARRQSQTFFFEPEIPYGLTLMRITLPIVMMAMVLPRWPVCRELFSTDGAPAPLAWGYGYYHLLPEFSGATVVPLYTLMCLSLITISVGFFTRLSLVVALVLFTYFSMLDAVSTMTKYSVISTHLLLLLSLSDCGKMWSVDAWLSREAQGNVLYAAGPRWPRRCIQLLIGFIYFGAAITKMNTPAFLTGDQLQFWMLTHINFRHPLGEVFSLYPVLLKMMSYVALVWEVTFIFLVWRGMWRPWVLSVGVLFHLMTTVTLGLLIFPMLCFSCYLSYLDGKDVKQIRRWWSTVFQQEPWLAAGWRRWRAIWPDAGAGAAWRPAAWVAGSAGVMLLIVAGAAWESHLDRYGLRRPEGRYALQTVDPELVKPMLAPLGRLRDDDKIFAIDTGTMLIGDLLANRRKVFRHGETIIAQCNLTPPHEDMWIECKLLDGGNRLVDRFGNIAVREQFRANFLYKVRPTLEPGSYTLVFEHAGNEVIRKSIQIVGPATKQTVALK